MNAHKNEKSSTFTKMQQAYWEARRSLGKTIGKEDDDCLQSTDLMLDTRIELLHSASISFEHLEVVLQRYSDVLKKLKRSEEDLSVALEEYGVKDTTKAGAMLTVCGKAMDKISQKRTPLQSMVVKILHEVQSFQKCATFDTLETVSRMERARKSYRSGLMWMKKESMDLDPEARQCMQRFYKVQDHIKRLQLRFNNSKRETLAKIDLFMLSRCNFFSKLLLPYQEECRRMNSGVVTVYKRAKTGFPEGFSYRFEVLKGLNVYLKEISDPFCKLSNSRKSKKFLKKPLPERRQICKTNSLTTFRRNESVKCNSKFNDIENLSDFALIPTETREKQIELRNQSVETTDLSEESSFTLEKAMIKFENEPFLQSCDQSGNQKLKFLSISPLERYKKSPPDPEHFFAYNVVSNESSVPYSNEAGDKKLKLVNKFTLENRQKNTRILNSFDTYETSTTKEVNHFSLPDSNLRTSVFDEMSDKQLKYEKELLIDLNEKPFLQEDELLTENRTQKYSEDLNYIQINPIQENANSFENTKDYENCRHLFGWFDDQCVESDNNKECLIKDFNRKKNLFQFVSPESQYVLRSPDLWDEVLSEFDPIRSEKRQNSASSEEI